MELRNECHRVLEPFIHAYSKMCRERQWDTSEHMYSSLVEEFLDTIPISSTRMFVFSKKKLDVIVEKVHSQHPKAHKNSINLALNRLLQACKKELPHNIDGKVLVRKRVRSEEIAIHDQSAFRLLDDFIEIRRTIIQKIKRMPRSKRYLPELVITSLIAVNGVCLTNAHLHIAASRSKVVIKRKNCDIIEVPKSRYTSPNPPSMSYLLLPDIRNLISGLNSNEWLFPSPFNPTSRSDKRRRSQKLNEFLNNLWTETFGDEMTIPKEWNIRTFISCTRLFILLNSSPIITSALSGKNVFAGYLDEHESNDSQDLFLDEMESRVPIEVIEQKVDETSALLASELISVVQSLLNSVYHRDQTKKTRQLVRENLIFIAATNYDILNVYPSLRSLIFWIKWELEKSSNKRRFGTFQSYWSFLPRMFLEEFRNEDPISLDGDTWLKMSEYFIQENTHAQSTRSKIKQHLKMYHNYLTLAHPDKITPINWRNSALYVASESVKSVFPTFEEFDLLYQKASEVKDEIWSHNLQMCLVFAFFGGLRAEEICLLSNQDLDEVNIQVRVWWSKTKMGRRRVPIYMLTPPKYMRSLHLKELSQLKQNQFLLLDENGGMVSPDVLGKKIKKIIEEVLPNERNMSLHSLRHGFASWLVVRYFALNEPEILKAKYENGENIITNPEHDVFLRAANIKLVRVFNGRVDSELYAKDPKAFFSKPEHFSNISRLIGHATRKTTARTYVHSMEWLAFYYINKLSK